MRSSRHIIASRRRTTAGALGARPSSERGGVDLHSPSCCEATARPCLAAMRLSRNAKCAGKRLRVRLGLCPGSDGPLRSPARSRLRMVRHCVRLTTPARTCSTTYQRRPRRGILGRRPPSCFSLRLMAWMTSALRRGKSSLRYSCRPSWCRKGLKAGKTNRDKKPRCAAGLSAMTSGEGRPPRRHFNARMSVRFQPLTTLTTGRSNIHAAAAFRIGQRAARSLPERWPAVPLLV